MSTFELDDELIEEFVLETRETIDEVEVTLIELERGRAAGDQPSDERINTLFRAFHSVKGSAGFLGMGNLVRVTHSAESLLDLVRSGSHELGSPEVDALCDALDFSRAAVDLLEQGKDDTGMNPEDVLASLAALTTTAPEESISLVLPEPSEVAAPTIEPPPIERDVPPPPVAELEVPAPPSPVAELEVPAPPTPELEVPAPPPPVAELNVPSAPEPASPTPLAVVSEPTATKPKPKNPAQSAKQKSIRVDVDKLEILMNLMGELILAQTSVTHSDESKEAADTQRRSILHLNRVTRSLQDVVMSLRMVPIEATLKKMQRLVRDLAKGQSKQVQLDLTGLDTEVDKNLIEAIGDPLVHIIRNSVDHGLELPEDRVAAGKEATGTVSIDACHQAGEVWITIKDDGKGLDPVRIKQIAVERGVIRAEAVLSDEDVFSLIFEPGFSTAAQVTDVSGRGVGMDVVRRNIQAMNGRVEVSSELGKGTVVRLRLPLTLAIIEGMLVRQGRMKYTIPLLAIRESVAVYPGLVKYFPDGRKIARVRGEIVPVCTSSVLPGVESDGGILIVVENGGRTFAVPVDELLGQRQTVVKALPAYLAAREGLAGCSILPDGEITLILDLGGIWELSASESLMRSAS